MRRWEHSPTTPPAGGTCRAAHKRKARPVPCSATHYGIEATGGTGIGDNRATNNDQYNIICGIDHVRHLAAEVLGPLRRQLVHGHAIHLDGGAVLGLYDTRGSVPEV